MTPEVFFQVISVIAMFLFVILLAYFTTKIVASAQYKRQKNSNIKVIESTYLSPGKMIQLVKVVDKVMVIANTKDSVSLLGEVDQGKVNYEEDFKSYLDFFVRRNNDNEK